MGKSFWDRVRVRMAELKLTQEDVANKTGVNLRTLQGWFSKDRMPRADQAVLIAKALSTTTEYFEDGIERMVYKTPEDMNIVIYDTEELPILYCAPWKSTQPCRGAEHSKSHPRPFAARRGCRSR